MKVGAALEVNFQNVIPSVFSLNSTPRSLKRIQYFLALLSSFSNSRHPRFTYHLLRLPRHMGYRPTSTEVNPQHFMTILALHRSKLDYPCPQRPQSRSTANLQADCRPFSQCSIFRSNPRPIIPGNPQPAHLP